VAIVCLYAIRGTFHRPVGGEVLDMKPAPFGYHRATTIDQAVDFLCAYEGSARIIAGGQSLVPMLNMRLLRPDALIDVNRIAALTEIDIGPDRSRLGALVRHQQIETSPAIAAALPLLREVVRHVGDRQVRNRGTIGGSLAHGDPTAELPLACLCLNASVSVRGQHGDRTISMDALYESSYATTLDPCELLTAVTFPERPAHFAFAESCRRHNDFAVVSVAAVGDRDPAGTWRRVRIGLGGVADTPILARDAMALLSGSELDDAAVDAAAQAAAGATDPPTDVRASADYRRHLTAVYVRRVLHRLREVAR
jgi:aerobic carbon-monoxide dehydrogenase medium subunit